MNTETTAPAVIDMIAVQSSQIKAIGYDAPSKTLAVQFVRDNSTYRYAEFPKEKWDEFYTSASKGAYFGANIRHGGYVTTKM